MRFGVWVGMAVVLGFIAQPSWAQMPMFRAQTQAIERAVTHNIERAFKPKLVVKEGATGPVTALALSDDEHLLVTAVGDNTMRVWDLWLGREIARLAGHQARITAIALAKDGTRAVTAAADGAVKAWDLKQLGDAVDLGRHASAVTGVALAPSGNRLVTAAADGRVRVWSMPDGKTLREFAAHDSGFTRVAVSPDGSVLISAGADGKVRRWAMETGAALGEMDAGSPVLALAISGDGSKIAAGTAGGAVLVWQADGTATATMADSAKVTGASFFADSGRLLTGDADGVVKVWNATTGGEISTLGKHDATVSFTGVSHDGKLALSGSEDGTARLWNVSAAKALLTLISTQTGWAVVDANGRYDGSQTALDGIEWQAEDVSANIDDFAETHYQASLLPRTLQGGGDLPDAKSIPDGARYPATIRFVTPTEDGTEANKQIEVEVVAEDAGGGVSELRLYRNGKLVPAASGQIEREERGGKTRLVGHYKLDVNSGTVKLSASALNSDRLESKSRFVTLVSSLGVANPGRLHILAVGINKYADSSLDLGFARADAESIANYFGAAQRSSPPVAEVVMLYDDQATKENILAAIRRMRTVPAEDTVVIYLAGHGVSISDDWYFISHEITPKRAQDVVGKALSVADIKDEIEMLSADHTLLMFDTCHSGSAVSPLNDYRGMKSLRLLARTVGIHVLAATDKGQFSVESEQLKHGVFTYALLAGLGGNASTRRSQAVTAIDLIRYVQDQVPALCRKYADYVQYPTGYSRGVDFLLVGKGDGG